VIADPLTVGLVVNMPDGALQATERQFRDLLSAAAGDRPVRLRLFAIPEVPRSAQGRAYVRAHCEDIAALWPAELDGLIVTGTEPKAARLTDEPYWGALARLIDWAERRTISTVWSCLAAHAAVYRLDGIDRRLFPRKLSGLFDCEVQQKHALVEGCGASWRVPHSRLNDVPEEALAPHGYRVLTRAAGIGADLFVKESEALHLFVQGHLEYEGETLGREYRRDVKRFLRGERPGYPDLPCDCFGDELAAALLDFRACALERRDVGLMQQFPPLPASIAPWRGVATRLYRNWLDCLAQGRAAQRPDAMRLAV
jgi:homoserine O-succinyltransferase